MSRATWATAPIALAAALGLTTSAGAERLDNPLRFFEGRTEMVSIVRLLAKRPYRSRTLGRGEIHGDGSLRLVQQVHDEGRPAFSRRWRIRQVAPGRFSGTMSEARGPVTVQEVAGRYRFRFRMKGGLSIEQWLTPLADGRSARSQIIIRKLGMRVGSSEGTIRRLGAEPRVPGSGQGGPR